MPLTITPPHKAGHSTSIGALLGSSLAWAISQAYQAANAKSKSNAPTIVITENSHQAETLRHDVAFFLPEAPIHTFPDWETLPYDHLSPHQEIIAARLTALFHLPTMQQGLLFLPVASVLQKLPPRSFLNGACFLYRRGDKFNQEQARQALQQAGYVCVKQVTGHSEFSVRGSLLDVFPSDSKLPIRIDLFDEEIDSMRYFDVETQKTIRVVEEISLLPAKEYPLTPQGIQHFQDNYQREFKGQYPRANIAQQIGQGNTPAGTEYYLPLFFEQMASLFDYLPAQSLLIRIGDTEQAIQTTLDYTHERYAALSNNPHRPLLHPHRLYLQSNEVFRGFKAYPQLKLSPLTLEKKSAQGNAAITPLPNVALAHRKTDPAQALKTFLQQLNGSALITASSAGRQAHIDELLQRHGVVTKNVEDWAAWQTLSRGKKVLGLASAPLEKGFIMRGASASKQQAILTEEDLLGQTIAPRKTAEESSHVNPEAVLTNLTELVMDAPVVHEKHGVGRYKGLEKIAVQTTSPEFLVIEYAKGDRLYVPIADLHLIHRYSATESENAPLHKLGGEEWTRVKKRATQRIRDVASELLDIYARRGLKKGHRFAKPNADYHDFCEAFPFEETPDQLKSIDEIIEDMTSEQSMDRLVCGDVGFGKTEVAMRAAFLAVAGGKQVAMLVPTTLLAQQHHQNFCDRFSSWPMRIELVSRFGTKKENDAKVEALNQGTIDIVIGTHRLLQKSIQFKDLGLFILDEEHRFGVRQKEHLKTLKHEVDVLSLTATPIPRTLNMSLSGIRDLSLIATPPARRHAIRTTVAEWNDETLRDACLRELHRGGQVYFLHNDVKSIGAMVETLQALVPEALIQYGHGQMRENQLEKIMQDFFHQRFNILVCTTIIESGIDNPNANTVIINRADKLGLSQLYQIRGRVGRSHHQAYAHLLRPAATLISRDAEKRLDAIGSIQDLGAGFVLATHDLEIRGAGELLGDEQSGQIHAIGFTLYSSLLDRAIASMKRGEMGDKLGDDITAHQGTDITLSIPAVFPEDYIGDPHLRLVLYKRIANATTSRALDEIQIELIDRFGLLPDSAKNLFKAHDIKLKAQPLGIKNIQVGPQQVTLQFIEKPNINPDNLILLLQSAPKRYRFDGKNKLHAAIDEDNEKEDPLSEVAHIVRALG